MEYRLPIKVFDFFSGCGGNSKGFQNAGMDIVFALDRDPDSGQTFQENFPTTHFLPSKIEEVSIEAIKPFFEACEGHPVLFSGCAPCQPFTKQVTQHPSNDSRRELLDEFERFVANYQPEFVFVENVPGLQKVREDEGPFGRLLATLERLDYAKKYGVVASQRYGVPQKRRRLVLIASRLGPIDFPPRTHGPGTTHREYATVREWMDGFPPIEAGETHPTSPNHQAADLFPINLERIRATPEGGDRRSWPKHLWLKCHSNGYDGHTDTYARLAWDRLASCLTTKCISLSNGRFGHPQQDRAISAREAACLQTFPRDFIFQGSLASVARQIGNAVPVLLAQRFGENFINHFNEYRPVSRR